MDSHKITLTYLNIRQSISILLAKLVLTDLLLASIVIGLYYLLVQGGEFTRFAAGNLYLFLTIFGTVGLVKILFTIYVVLKWLFEYYEITPDNIIHKSGIFFRKKEQYDLNLVREMTVQDSFWGEIFNFGTITLYDIRLNKYLDMYLIHNPQRYANVLKQLRPDIEMQKDSVYFPLILPDKK